MVCSYVIRVLMCFSFAFSTLCEVTDDIAEFFFFNLNMTLGSTLHFTFAKQNLYHLMRVSKLNTVPCHNFGSVAIFIRVIRHKSRPYSKLLT